MGGSELSSNARQTVPIAGLVSTAQVTEILDISTEADYSFVMQVYSNVTASVSAAILKIVNL